MKPIIIQDDGLNLEELVLCQDAYVYLRNSGSLGLIAGWPELSTPAKMKLAEIHSQMKLLINEATEIIESETRS